MTTTSAAPLETLVLQQLTHLIQEEKTLAFKYPGLSSPQGQGTAQREAFSIGLQELRRRADRLQRFVDEMDRMGSAEQEN